MSRVEIYREDKKVRVPHGPLMGGGIELASTGWTERIVEGKGKWRWRYISNGHIMADSGQGYSRRIDALKGCATVLGGDVINDSETQTIRRCLEYGTYDFVAVRHLTREATS